VCLVRDESRLRLERPASGRKKPAVILAHVEKDRTGVLAGQSIPWPTFEKIARPLLGLLGTKQAAVPSDDAVSLQDAEALARQEVERMQRSTELGNGYTTRFGLADAVATLEQIAKELTPAQPHRQTLDSAPGEQANGLQLGSRN
jgi:hypothetical protein